MAESAPARADIVVGLTAYNDVRTIGAVTGAVRDGLSRAFGSSVAQIVLADGRSTDGTRQAAREAAGCATLVEIECPPAALAEIPYHGSPARAAALRAILQTAQRLGAKACACLDGSVTTVTPEWIERLVGPVLSEEVEYVSPYYVRRVDEGAITKAIVYPTFRALYGVRLRQPAASEFGCSARLTAHLLDQEFWELDQVPLGIDLWLATAAVVGGFSAAEASLGVRTAARETSPNLSTTLAQVVGSIFADLERRVEDWQRVRKSVTVPIRGPVPDLGSPPPSVNVDELLASFRLGYRELREIWTFVLPPRTIVELRKLTETDADALRFDDRLWASIVYDFALGYTLRVMPQDHLLRSLTPLYTAWLASFVSEMKGADLNRIDARVEQVCQAFESEKRYLIARWRWPERLR